MFLALGISRTSQALEPSEKISSVLVPWETAVKAASRGGLVDEVGLAIEDCGSRLIILLAETTFREL